MENKPAISHSNLPCPPKEANPENYWKSNKWRRWELSVNYNTKFYLTDEEKDYFLEQLKLGKKIILVGEMVLTKSFNYLVPLREKYKPLEPGEIRYK